MRLDEYFDSVQGIGVLATADAAGKVNVAIYSRPHFLGDDDQEVAFIMNDRLSHDNVESNPHAAYLFIEETKGYVGKRLFLTKTREETDHETILSVRRRNLPAGCDEGESQKKFLVHFRVDGIRPLIGTGDTNEAGRHGAFPVQLPVFHCFAEAVHVANRRHCLPCGKQWHTLVRSAG